MQTDRCTDRPMIFPHVIITCYTSYRGKKARDVVRVVRAETEMSETHFLQCEIEGHTSNIRPYVATCHPSTMTEGQP
jgi:hypothetical protein